MKSQRIIVNTVISSLIAISFSSAVATGSWAGVAIGSKCTSVGQHAMISGKAAVCTQIGIIRIWTNSSVKLPNVVGMGLPHAEDVLTAAKYTFDEHPLDGSLGIIVKENWLVCKEVSIGSKYVRLDVSKYGC